MSGTVERFAVFGFDSTHDALRAEAVLLEADAEVAIIPTPRGLGTLCGFAVRVPIGDLDADLATMGAAGLTPNGTIEIGDRTPR